MASFLHTRLTLALARHILLVVLSSPPGGWAGKPSLDAAAALHRSSFKQALLDGSVSAPAALPGHYRPMDAELQEALLLSQQPGVGPSIYVLLPNETWPTEWHNPFAHHKCRASFDGPYSSGQVLVSQMRAWPNQAPSPEAADLVVVVHNATCYSESQRRAGTSFTSDNSTTFRSSEDYVASTYLLPLLRLVQGMAAYRATNGSNFLYIFPDDYGVCRFSTSVPEAIGQGIILQPYGAVPNVTAKWTTVYTHLGYENKRVCYRPNHDVVIPPSLGSSRHPMPHMAATHNGPGQEHRPAGQHGTDACTATVNCSQHAGAGYGAPGSVEAIEHSVSDTASYASSLSSGNGTLATQAECAWPINERPLLLYYSGLFLKKNPAHSRGSRAAIYRAFVQPFQNSNNVSGGVDPSAAHGQLAALQAQQHKNVSREQDAVKNGTDCTQKARPILVRDDTNGFKHYTQCAQFCPSPGGWGSWTPRTYWCLVYGTTPVLICDGCVLPFERLLPWRTFTLKMLNGQSGVMLQLLQRASANYAAMAQRQATAAVFARYLLWQTDVLFGPAAMVVLELACRMWEARRQQHAAARICAGTLGNQTSLAYMAWAE